MSPEEKPSERSDPESPQSNADDSINVAENSSTTDHWDPVEASVVDHSQPVEVAVVEPVMAEAAGHTDDRAGITLVAAPPIARHMENMAAKGGGIGALVLGTWCIVGSFITYWSIINGVIGLLMGFWGLTSRKRKTALIGIALCIVGMFMSLVQVSELVNTYLNAVDESPY